MAVGRYGVPDQSARVAATLRRAGIERQPSPSRVALSTLGARRLEIGGGMCTRPMAVNNIPRRDSLTGSQPSMLGSNGAEARNRSPIWGGKP
jgi:hypothetical protein